MRATGIGGDFRLPNDPERPLLLVAGGIGITPFVSQLAHLDRNHHRDIVLVYLCSDPAEVAYMESLGRSRGRMIVVSKAEVPELPATFENVIAPSLGQEQLRAIVPDISSRDVYVSGPPGLVNSISSSARALKAKRVTKDYFSGY